MTSTDKRREKADSAITDWKIHAHTHTYTYKYKVFLSLQDGVHSGRTSKSERVTGQGSQCSFPEKGISCEGVEHVVGFPLGGLGQCKDLLLRHAGGNGDVALVQWVEALLVLRNAAVTGTWKVVMSRMENKLRQTF